ncbi:type II toxin-antitoxin system ParD family antitoxin [filamentous cyanobacterium LEGE 11480]|uniref:Type II toxin-antitoxin system ParD family antitoxin n=1 Tax=Romeriopsis navalis LEGE 11480 TaxID=2777977 RepID=A0A928VN00_9CYAN|nr:type II toxin-antitoxin system ParD family antitoxin [Romeriopsis navalis]MBE9031588.1 type II toxin-antitoxin system ParD family antitoxin [Romeriopsis navalis LEGE 11480]
MKILLDSEQTAFIESQLQSGQFSSAEDVVAKALNLMAQQQAEYPDQEWLTATAEKIQVGLADIQRGDIVDGETFMAELQHKLDQKRSQSA